MSPQRSAVIELRQYTLHPGRRDVLIELFDREFVETQEAVGLAVIGQFRDLDDPDRFVWLRGFRDMPARAEGLQAFYGGPVWRKYRDEANATMIDSDNVLLLRPARPDSGFAPARAARAEPRATEIPKGLVIATICEFPAPVGTDFVDFFERTVAPAQAEAGATLLAFLATEPSANNFPALPVREGEHVFVWFSLFGDQAAYETHLATLARSERWRGEIANGLARQLKRAEVRRLVPTARSQIHA